MLHGMRLILICHCVPFQFSCNLLGKLKKNIKEKVLLVLFVLQGSDINTLFFKLGVFKCFVS